jgi:hypothetical protein
MRCGDEGVLELGENCSRKLHPTSSAIVNLFFLAYISSSQGDVGKLTKSY